MTATRKPAIAFIFVTVLIDVMGIGLLLPVIPSLVREFAGSPDSTAYWYGALMFTFGISQFLCAPVLGALSDRYGRRPVLLLSIAGLGTMFLLSAVVTSLPALLLTRVFGGALAANFSVANAYVADVSAPEDRAKGFGMVGAAFGIGFIIGPAIGGLLGDIDIRLPFVCAAALSALNFLYGFFVLPESLPLQSRRKIDFAQMIPFRALFGLARLRGVGALIAVYALANLAQFILHGIWVLFTTYRFNWGPKENGISLFVVGLVAALVQGLLLGKLLKQFGERRVVLLGLCSATLAYLAYGLAHEGWMMYAITAVNLLSFALGAALNAIVSKAAEPNAQGIAMGSLSSLASLTALIAPLLGAPLFAQATHLPRDALAVGAPFFLSAILSGAALLLALWHFGRERRMRGAAVIQATS